MRSFKHFYQVILLQDIRPAESGKIVWKGMAPKCLPDKTVQWLAARKIRQIISGIFKDDGLRAGDVVTFQQLKSDA